MSDHCLKNFVSNKDPSYVNNTEYIHKDMGATKSIMMTARHHLPMILHIVSSNLLRGNGTVPSWSDCIFREKQ